MRLPKRIGKSQTVQCAPAGAELIVEDAEDFAVIKDSYRDVQRRFQEDDLLRHIHSDGNSPDVVRNFPGVVRVLAAGDVKGFDGKPIVTRSTTDGPGKVGRRGKKRLVMGSRGSQPSAAESVKDVLMAIYDGAEGIVQSPFFSCCRLSPT